MKVKNILVVLLGFITYFTLQLALRSYEHTKAHPSINEVIVEKFDKYYGYEVKIDKFKNYTFNFDSDLNKLTGLALTNPGYFERTTENSEVSKICKRVDQAWGIPQMNRNYRLPVRHFYDPTKPEGSRILTNREIIGRRVS